ncbi:MAG: YeeE/YedE thiosulfate transporter family protein [Bacteroidota bacterium]
MVFVTFFSTPMEYLSQPWHWSISGVAIAGILFLMTWMGRSFGVSTAFRNFCTIAGAGKKHPFFDINLKDEDWRMAFVLGAVLGGFVGAHLLTSPEAVAISSDTIAHLKENFGMSYPQGGGFLPTEVFNFTNPKGIILTIIGGFFVGFGARYGRGCTSGHAITGLSHLQLPSLLTVIGFFIGGLIMTWWIMPFIF